MKTSYRIQLLLWMRTNLVVHVSNLKRYYFDPKDIKQKQVVWRHTNKKKVSSEESRKDTNREDMKTQQTEKWFQQHLVGWKRLLIMRSAGSALRDLKSASSNKLCGGRCHSHDCPRRVACGCMLHVSAILVNDLLSKAVIWAMLLFTDHLGNTPWAIMTVTIG